MIRAASLAAALAGAAIAQSPAQGASSFAPVNDFPTAARADYVFACMASNGVNPDTLERCACSIDHIATLMSYDAYVKAETVLRTIQLAGERTAAFRNSARHQALVADMRRAQAEADIVCF